MQGKVEHRSQASALVRHVQVVEGVVAVNAELTWHIDDQIKTAPWPSPDHHALAGGPSLRRNADKLRRWPNGPWRGGLLALPCRPSGRHGRWRLWSAQAG